MSRPPVLTRADQVLVNALGFLVATTMVDDRHRVVIDVLREVLPQAEPQHPMTEALHLACHATVAAWGVRRGDPAAWMGAMLQADAAVATILYWRAGLALDALRAAAEPAPTLAPAATGV